MPAKRARKEDSGGDGGLARPVELAGSSYSSHNKLFSHVLRAVARAPRGTPLVDTPDAELLKELVQHHPRGAAKVKDMVHLEVGERTVGGDVSRCLYIVRKDGSKDDISWIKCVNSVCESAQQEAAEGGTV